MHSRCYFLPLYTRHLWNLLSRFHFTMTLKRIHQVILCMNEACLTVLGEADTVKSKKFSLSVKGEFTVSVETKSLWDFAFKYISTHFFNFTYRKIYVYRALCHPTLKGKGGPEIHRRLWSKMNYRSQRVCKNLPSFISKLYTQPGNRCISSSSYCINTQWCILNNG